jgi:hypothetical protein
MRKWQIKLCLRILVTLGSGDPAPQISIEQQMYRHPQKDKYHDHFGGHTHKPIHNAAGAMNNPVTQQKSAARFLRKITPL